VEGTSTNSLAIAQKLLPARTAIPQSNNTEPQGLEPFLLQDFIVHVKGEQEDIRAKSSNGRQSQLLEVIRYFCDFKRSINKREEEQKEANKPKNVIKPLPIFGCFELKQYYKSQKDATRGIEKMPGDHLIINKRLASYPDFNIIIEYIRSRSTDQWRTSSFNFKQPFQSMIGQPKQQNNAVLHHGGHQKDTNQMYTFQSSCFDSQQFNDSTFFGDDDKNEQILMNNYLERRQSDSETSSSKVEDNKVEN